jgi:hypothetical protein
MDKLIVPVYLNQRLVFDLLAMLHGGISTVTSITKTESSGTSDTEKMKASFGLSQVLSSLLKIDLSGEQENKNSMNQVGSISEQRVHTPASLFYQLRTMLLEKDFLRVVDNSSTPTPGDIIEFEASLRRNPIIETIQSVSEMLEVAMIFEEPKPHSKMKTKQVPVQDNKKLKSQMEAFCEKLRAGNTMDLIAEDLVNKYSAVVTLELGFLNDPTMSDVVDGRFYILGKVIQTIMEDTESISLIRKTALSKLPSTILVDAFSVMSTLATDGFAIPELKWEIKGPAIQIIPIAIYA